MRILHCLRAPVGGLFRHVCDLAAAQAGMSHEIGVICDARTGGSFAGGKLDALAEQCTLGIHRVAMSRQLGIGDISATRAVRRIAAGCEADVLHGHGAKGGAYARLAAARLKRRGAKIVAFYTPHGGSLHYSPESLAGRIFMTLERRLGKKTDGLIFESAYSGQLYQEKIGPYPCAAEIIPNGLAPDEFYEPVLATGAADFLFVAELRRIKGLDIMLEALGSLAEERPDVSAFIVGAGPDETVFKRMAGRLGLTGAVTFADPMPARSAFSRGRCLIVPSRAESLPYIVLEAAAARLPIIASRVGGIPEIVAGSGCELVAPADAEALMKQMRLFLNEPAIFVQRAASLQKVVSTRYSVAGMARSITWFYRRILDQSG